MIKTTVSMTPELYSALTRAALDSGTNVSREIETHLRENTHIQKYIKEVRAEPDGRSSGRPQDAAFEV